MDEKALLDWKEAHEDVYSKFRQDLEEQLLQPYHQTILDMGDGDVEPLKSVIANFSAISSKDDIDIEKTLFQGCRKRRRFYVCLCCFLVGNK